MSVGSRIWREELMAKALEIWSPEVIEEALGADAGGRVRLPRHHVAMLEHFADRDAPPSAVHWLGSSNAIASARGRAVTGDRRVHRRARVAPIPRVENFLAE